MGTKTISLADDAYERLKAAKREGESFSDVVRRLTSGVALTEFYGVLEDDTTADLERIVAERRSAQTSEHRDRIDRLTGELDS